MEEKNNHSSIIPDDYYAPVLIPTLNRYDHFKRCLESLERCTGADKTDVYVGLDFPPSEKYVEGWKKIDAYLAVKEKNHGFKNLYVRRRSHNCGVGKPNSNVALLRKEIESTVDFFVSSEDDNEFSPNYLEYMNKALELYKDDPNVIKVSAYTPHIFTGMSSNSTFFGIDSPAYGWGTWTKKNRNIAIDYEVIKKELKSSFKRTWSLFRMYPALIYMAAHMVNAKRNFGDIRFSMHNLLYGTYTLMPTRSLVRNWGTDGSGLHSGVVKGIEKEEIQTESHFELDKIPHEYPKELKKRLFYRNMPTNKVKFVVYLIHKFLYVMRFFFLG